MLDIQTISVGLGLFVGLILGLSGAGGSIFAIPLLVLVLNLTLTEAVPISLIAIMAAASIGSAQGLYKGNVRYKAAALMGLFGILLAPIGIWLAYRIPTDILIFCFAMLMLHIAYRMWHETAQKGFANKNSLAPPCEVNPASSKLFWTAYCTKQLVATGGLAGILAGMIGVGGGFVIVPSLRKVSNLDFQTIIATSLAVITIVSAGTVTIYIQQDAVNWHIAIPFVLGTIISMFVSRLVSHKIPTIISQRIFSILAVVASILMVIKILS